MKRTYVSADSPITNRFLFTPATYLTTYDAKMLLTAKNAYNVPNAATPTFALIVDSYA